MFLLAFLVLLLLIAFLLIQQININVVGGTGT